jgi:hypothetical protein
MNKVSVYDITVKDLKTNNIVSTQYYKCGECNQYTKPDKINFKKITRDSVFCFQCSRKSSINIILKENENN